MIAFRECHHASEPHREDDRLTLVDTGSTASYIYNAEGTRVHENVGGAVEEFLNGEGPQSLTIVDASQNPVQTDYSFGGRPLATATTGGMFFAATDTLGTVRARLNASGAIVESDTSWPYGEFRNYANAISRIHFTGKLDDTESGLDSFGARYYASSLGRFMNPDWSASPEAVPFANLDNPQSLNLYSYVLNNPVTATDPDGHWCFWHMGTTCSAAPVTPPPTHTGDTAYDPSFLGSLRDGLLGARDALTGHTPSSATAGERQAADVDKLVIMGGVGGEEEAGEQALRLLPKLTQFGWEGSESWRAASALLKSGGTIEQIAGKVPTQEEAEALIAHSGGRIERVEGPHSPPNPHTYDPINFTTAAGAKGTIRVGGGI